MVDINPLDMNYNELSILLDSMLKKENLPNTITYKETELPPAQYNVIKIILKLFIIKLEWFILFHTYIKKRINKQKNKTIFATLKQHFINFKMILPEILNHFNKKFDSKIFINYFMAAMLYDESCDNPLNKKYLNDFNKFIMFDKNFTHFDENIKLFTESVDYLKRNIGRKDFDTFKKYMKIEHISQLLSIYQHSDKILTKDELKKITLAKGGMVVLGLVHLMMPELNKKQRIAIFELGGILQILEDVLDIQEDIKLGIRTLPNQKMLKPVELEKMFAFVLNNVIEQLSLNPKNLDGFLYGFYLSKTHIFKLYQDYVKNR